MTKLLSSRQKKLQKLKKISVAELLYDKYFLNYIKIKNQNKASNSSIVIFLFLLDLKCLVEIALLSKLL